MNLHSSYVNWIAMLVFDLRAYGILKIVPQMSVKHFRFYHECTLLYFSFFFSFLMYLDKLFILWHCDVSRCGCAYKCDKDLLWMQWMTEQEQPPHQWQWHYHKLHTLCDTITHWWCKQWQDIDFVSCPFIITTRHLVCVA